VRASTDLLLLRRQLSARWPIGPHRALQPLPERVYERVHEAKSRAEVHRAASGQERVRGGAVSIGAVLSLDEPKCHDRVREDPKCPLRHPNSVGELLERCWAVGQRREQPDLVSDEQVF
jgi:hypothetical protein